MERPDYTVWDDLEELDDEEEIWEDWDEEDLEDWDEEEEE